MGHLSSLGSAALSAASAFQLQASMGPPQPSAVCLIKTLATSTCRGGWGAETKRERQEGQRGRNVWTPGRCGEQVRRRVAAPPTSGDITGSVSPRGRLHREMHKVAQQYRFHELLVFKDDKQQILPVRFPSSGVWNNEHVIGVLLRWR